MRTRKGFTLIELLTVIAITAVLLTLIILPIFQSFNITRAAQGYADAQQKARLLTERIAREISNSAGIRDNAGLKGAMNVVVPGQDGTPVTVPLAFAKLDVIKPAEGDPALRGPGGGFINPRTGREDPTLNAPKGQVVLPVVPGNTVVRYFIGLRDPFAAYTNPYDGLLMARSGARDNLFVLYRVEVQPYVWANGRYVVNNQFFFDLDRDNDPNTTGPLFDDASFFDPNVALPAYATGPEPSLPADPSKADMVRNWIREATVLTEVSRYDMVMPVFNKQTRRVIYDNNVPRLLALVQFRPTSIGNEPVEGQAAVRISEETDRMADLAPDVFNTKFGSWSSLVVRMSPTGWNPTAPTAYTVGRVSAVDNRFTVFYFDPSVHTNELTDGVELFSSQGYLESVQRGDSYPFSRAIYTGNLNPTTANLFVPYVADPKLGKITTSFDIGEVGNIAGPVRPVLNPLAGTGLALSPLTDTGLPALWTDPLLQPSSPTYGINRLFNKVWRDQSNTGSSINFNLLPNVHRFVDLRVLPFSDGSVSPLHPTQGFARARIVPGSDVVIGPDQNPGPNYGNPVRYTRVTRNPGPNQYRINYVDLAEPTNPATNAVDYSIVWPGMPNPPVSYSPTDFVSAVIQPRFRAGYVQFNSDPNVPLPQGNIEIGYRFQLNRPGDVFAADYDSRQLINVALTIRNYPQTSTPNPQMVTLQSTATVRNVLR